MSPAAQVVLMVAAATVFVLADVRRLRAGFACAAPWTATSSWPGEPCSARCFVARLIGICPTAREEARMSVPAILETPVTSPAAEDPFALDVQVITDVPPGHPLAGCSGNTDDGCDPTCASACVTGGV